MADLSKEITAFEEQLPVLKERIGSRHWVVFLGGECRGDFANFSEAMEFGMSKFPDADFLVRQIDAPKAQLPFLMVVA